jgi:hypothetical protein
LQGLNIGKDVHRKLLVEKKKKKEMANKAAETQ